MDQIAKAADQAEAMLTELGYLNGSFIKAESAFGIRYDMERTLDTYLDDSRYRNKDNNVPFRVKINGAVGYRKELVPLVFRFELDQVADKVQLSGLSAGFRGCTLEWGQGYATSVPPAFRLGKEIQQKMYGNVVSDKLANASVRPVLKALHRTGFVKDMDRLEPVLLYRIGRQMISNREADTLRVQMPIKVQHFGVNILLDMEYSRSRDKVNLVEVSGYRKGAALHMKPGPLLELMFATRFCHCLTMDAFSRSAALTTLNQPYKIEERSHLPAERSITGAENRFSQLVRNLEQQGFLNNNDPDCTVQKYMALLTNTLQSGFLPDRDSANRHDFIIPMVKGRGSIQELSIELHHRYGLESKSLSLVSVSLQDAGSSFRETDDHMATFQKLHTKLNLQQQLRGIAGQLVAADYVGCDHAYMQLSNLFRSGMREIKNENNILARLPLDRLHTQGNASLRACLQLNHKNQTCRLICIEAEKQGVKLQLFPDRNGILPDGRNVQAMLERKYNQMNQLSNARNILNRNNASSRDIEQSRKPSR